MIFRISLLRYSTSGFRVSRRIRSVALVGVAFVLLGGCKQEPSPARASAASASASGAPTGSKLMSGAAAECTAYAKRICEIAGPESPTCIAMQGAAEVMPKAACSAGLSDIAYSENRIVKGQNICDHLVQKICEAVGPTTRACQKVTADTKNFTAKRCVAMTEHLPEVIAEVQEMKLSTREPVSDELKIAMEQGAPIAFGPESAKVHIVEFSDFECTSCARMARVIHKVQQAYGDRVRVTFRHFPLKKHENARLAAEASMVAHRQGKFWDFHNRLFDAKTLDRAALEEQAKLSGLELATFKTGLDKHEFAAAVDSDIKLGERIPLKRTPSVFINGVRVDYAADFEAISDLIEAELKREQG